MSSTWNQAAAIQNHNNATGFNHMDPNAGGTMLDPSAFMNNPSSFDPSQFQNPPLQRMQNGSPAFNSPIYQTNSVIPSKRPRPREDSMGTSPRQGPGMLPNSRSQTPQQNPYPGFPQNNAPPAHAPQQTPYAHLQNGSANASPSPVMSNQLRPGGVPQRVSTASPHPFSPAAQQFPQPSPSQSEHGSRVDTPQQNNPYAQNPGFAPGFNQNFTPPPGRTSAPPQSAMSTPHMQPHMQQPQQMYQQGQPQQPQQRPQNSLEAQKMMYQMQLQQQLQQRNAMVAQRGNLPPNANPMARGPMMPGPNGQVPGMRPQQGVPQPSRGGPNPENFMKSVATFMQSKGLPLDPNPIVGDRQLPLIQLYMAVAKFGGYKKVTMSNAWQQVAQALQFHPIQHPNAPNQLRGHYERNLAQFEEAWQMNQQRQRAAMMQQNPQLAGQQMSPTKQMTPQQAMQQNQEMLAQQQQRQMMLQQNQNQQHPQTTPVKQMTPMHHPQQVPVNGFSTPQSQGPPHPLGPQGHGRNSLSRSVDVTPPQNGSFAAPSPLSSVKGGLNVPQPLSGPAAQAGVVAPPTPQEHNLPEKLDPKVRNLDTYGGIEVESLDKLGRLLVQYRPDIPSVHDLGTIDIHALTMSLQSGIHAEVRMALDTLASLSVEARLQLDLRVCEDLVETLVDCAEDQVELLAENAAEVSDQMLISSYEDVIRGARYEQEILQVIPDFGSHEYELDRAVDRLICITTILRNFSFFETNHALLADELVIKFLCVVIRYLGTRNMLLRTNQNTLDFMKDVIIFLSNLAQAVEIPSREQALCLLHFLLAFAPCPPPNGTGESVSFSSYDPNIHRYLPPAVDSLAKLLARDEPNRTHYKTIFASDVSSSPPFDLLTRSFGLAVSVIPEDTPDIKRNIMPVTEARKPFLMQGMLAAEILSNLAPGFETGVAKSWLTSEDGFSQNLCRLILLLCLEASPPQQPHSRNQTPPKGVEDEFLMHITIGGISVLQKLAEKSKNPEDPMSSVPVAGLPSKDALLAALKIVQPKVQPVLRLLCAYAGLGS